MDEQPSDKIQLSRRQAVAALGAGVLVAGGAAAFTGVEITAEQQRAAEQQRQDMQLQVDELQKNHAAVQSQLTGAQAQLAATQVQLEVYKGLVGFYETLDGIGIDSIITNALNTYQATLNALGSGVDALKAGIVTAENALDSFEQGFASIRSALDAAENAWANVSALFKNAQDLIKNATSPLLPLVDQATKFFSDLLGKIPFGVGDSVQQTINGIIGLIVAIPSAGDVLQNGLFKTLRDGWFSDDNARTLETRLAKPITNSVLEPLRTFLDKVDSTLQAWETQVSKPVNDGLAQRKILQQQINDYKKKNNL
jgi:exonuclease VII small subunit